MSVRATLLLIFASLAGLAASFAALSLAEARATAKVAREAEALMADAATLRDAAGVVAEQGLSVYAAMSSSRRLRGDRAEAFQASLDAAETELAALVETLSPETRAAAQAVLLDYAGHRDLAVEDAKASAMLRDVSLRATWMEQSSAASSTLFQLGVAPLRAAAAGDLALTLRVEIVDAAQAAKLLLLRDAAIIAGRVASRSFLNPEVAGRLAAAWGGMNTAFDRIETLAARLDDADTAGFTQAMRAGLEADYGVAREAIVAVGVNGGEYPMSYGDWFERATGALDRLLSLQNAVQAALADTARAGKAVADENAYLALGGIAVVALVTLVGVYLLLLRVLRPLAAAVRALRELAEGDVDVNLSRLPKRYEIGALRQAITRLAEVSREARTLAEDERRRADAEAEARAQGAAVLAQVDAMIGAASRGDLAVALDAAALEGVDDNTRALAQGVERLRKLMLDFTADARAAVEALRDGDLRQRMPARYEGALGAVADAYNDASSRIADLVDGITQAVDGVRVVSEQMVGQSQNLSSRSTSQAAALEETVATMTEVSRAVTTNVASAETADGLSRAAAKGAAETVDVAHRASDAMRSIDESSAKIADITAMVEDIAFQTNLLALNAAVEAARAGASGKGFAVVAQEVRSLAGRASDAAREIKTLIETSGAQIANGVSLVGDTGARLKAIGAEMDRVAEAVADITRSSREQSGDVATVSQSLNAIDQVAQQNAGLANETSDGAHQLSREADRLTELVSVFRTEATAGATAGASARAAA